MKLRLFLIIWIVFVITALSSALIFSEIIRRERLRNLDAQIESLAGVLIGSESLSEGIADLKEADELIEGIIGSYRLGLVIILRNRSGKIVYRNKNATVLQLEPSSAQPWQFVKKDDDVIRVHTLSRTGRTLQLGLVAAEDSLRPPLSRILFSGYSLAILGVSGIIAYFLTLILLRPLRKLSDFLAELSRHLSTDETRRSTLPKVIENPSLTFFGKADELQLLIHSLNQFLGHLEGSLLIHGAQAALLAHEINTPLTIIQNKLSDLRQVADPQALKKIQEMEAGLHALSEFVRRYLQLSESVHQPLSSTSIFAVRLEEFIPQILERLKGLYPSREIQIKELHPLTIFVNTSDIEQVIYNLLKNAIKYSPEGSTIFVSLIDGELTVSDYGTGIPNTVLSRLGQPFNRSEQGGSGLGLAWVSALCRKYSWKLHIESRPGATTVSIHFTDPHPDGQPL